MSSASLQSVDAPEIKCPAGQARNPVLSPNVLDVECRIMGNMQPAIDREGKPVVCCANYSVCRVWQTHIEVERGGPSTKAQRDQAVATRRARDVI